MRALKECMNKEIYALTPLGLLKNVIDESAAAAAADALTLYMIRNAKPGHFMGIVADCGVLSFVQVHKGEPE